MSFKLCRFLNKSFLIRMLVFFLLSIAVLLIFESTDEPTIPAIFFSTLIIFFIASFFEPSKFRIENEAIKLVEYHYEDKENGFSFIITKPHRISKRVTVTISRIEKIEYISNLLERAFNLGHIKIQGSVYMEKKNGEPLNKFDVPQTHYIWGIKHFKTTKTKIKQLLPKAEHCEIVKEK